jgi:hypothetical protein
LIKKFKYVKIEKEVNMKKVVIIFFIFGIFFLFSCVQVRPWISYSNSLPVSHFYSSGYLDEINDNQSIREYLVNDVYVSAGLSRYPHPYGKLYRLGIGFTAKDSYDKVYTSFIINEIKIISKSGLDYSNKIENEFPINTMYSPSRGGYSTEKIFKLRYEEILLKIAVEVNTVDSSESKILNYKFKPEWDWALSPIFLLPYL